MTPGPLLLARFGQLRRVVAVPFKTTPEIGAGVEISVADPRQPWDKALVASFFAGCWIALAWLLAMVVSVWLDPSGSVDTLVTGAVFSMGVVLVVIAGSELLADNMALQPLGLLARRVTVPRIARNLGFVLIGNLLGSLFVAHTLPTAIFAHVAGVSWGDALRNWAFAFLGSFTGAAVFAAVAYWYLCVRRSPVEASGAVERP
jgi:formate/nitrite transporter FocA (FNT family)